MITDPDHADARFSAGKTRRGGRVCAKMVRACRSIVNPADRNMRILDFSRNDRCLRRAGIWVLLAAFLLLQVKAAIGGCLIDAYARVDVAAAMTSGNGEAVAGPADDCCPRENAPPSTCAEKCAPSASVSATPADHVLAVLPVASSAPLVVAAAPSDDAHAVVRAAGEPPGPPPYLRFLRLLN
jgi:hypothetical protein